MKKNIILAIVSAAALIFTSCQKSPVGSEKGVGYLSFSQFSLDVDETVVSKASPANSNYTISIYDADENLVNGRSYTYGEVINNDNMISLPAGHYTLVASSSADEVPLAAFEQPVYGVTTEFDIEAGEKTTIETLTCTLLQCKVTVAYSDDFLAMVTGECSTKVEITAGSPLTYVLNANKTYDQSAGYFAVNGNTMTVVFKGTINGKTMSQTKSFTNIAPKQWRQIKFIPKVNEEGGATFDIVIVDLIDDETLNNDLNASEDILGEDPDAPKGDGGIKLLPYYEVDEASMNKFEITYQTDENGDYIYDDYGEKKIKSLSIKITEPYLKNEKGQFIADMLIKLKLTVPNGLKKFDVDITTDNNAFATAVNTADATHLNLISPSELNMIIFDVVPFPYGSDLIGQTEIAFNLSNAQPAIINFDGNHTFTMTIVDQEGCRNVIPVTMIVDESIEE